VSAAIRLCTKGQDALKSRRRRLVFCFVAL
jgi:hypothetical protein